MADERCWHLGSNGFPLQNDRFRSGGFRLPHKSYPSNRLCHAWEEILFCQWPKEDRHEPPPIGQMRNAALLPGYDFLAGNCGQGLPNKEIDSVVVKGDAAVTVQGVDATWMRAACR